MTSRKISDYKWHLITDKDNIKHITDTDCCYCLMEYVSGGGYEPPSNSLIWNFKKPISLDDHQLQYKQEAIKRFASDLVAGIRQIMQSIDLVPTICFIPISKTSDHPQYDDRFERVLKIVKAELKDSINIEQPFHIKKSRKQSSQNKHQYGIQDYKSNFNWIGFTKKPQYLIIVDDVITWGEQFQACKQMIIEKMKHQIPMIGLFWSKTVQME